MGKIGRKSIQNRLSQMIHCRASAQKCFPDLNVTFTFNILCGPWGLFAHVFNCVQLMFIFEGGLSGGGDVSSLFPS